VREHEIDNKNLKEYEREGISTKESESLVIKYQKIKKSKMELVEFCRKAGGPPSSLNRSSNQ
jgi:hypothetical protein